MLEVKKKNPQNNFHATQRESKAKATVTHVIISH